MNENTQPEIGHKYVGAPKLVRAIRVEGFPPEYQDAVPHHQISNFEDLQRFGGDAAHVAPLSYREGGLLLTCNTGRVSASIGDWLIKAESGEVYPCSHEDFVARYHRVSDSFQAHERSTAEEDQTPPSTKSWGGLVADVPTDGLIPGYHGYVKTNMSTESVTTAFLPLALVLRTLWRLYVWAKAGPQVPLDPHEAFMDGYQLGRSDAGDVDVQFGPDDTLQGEVPYSEADFERAEAVRRKEADL